MSNKAIKLAEEMAARNLAKGATRKAERLVTEAPIQATLPFWDSESRGFPNSLARCALFTAAKVDESRDYYKAEILASLSGITIEYQGQELRQDDASVFITVLHLAREQHLGEPIYFTAYSMLKELGWSINSAEYKHLRECCSRLSATNLTVLAESGRVGYGGSLIRAFAWKDEDGKQMSSWMVKLEPKIAGLFAEDAFTYMDWSLRRKIGGRSPLALWLHTFLSTHRDPFPLTVSKYHELSRSRTKELFDFRRRLKLALQRLVDVEFLSSFKIENDLVRVVRRPRSAIAEAEAVVKRLRIAKTH